MTHKDAAEEFDESIEDERKNMSLDGKIKRKDTIIKGDAVIGHLHAPDIEI